ncbi:glucose-1-phosphate thymidylyltransferase [Fulvivirga sp. M361]|uniref:GlmU family protein n=1 Tax=Fulvivirga sp. M361 TaxID=2594266 RepID=UPI00117BBBBA|nr:GlmU family protein [Fulvivirga sp. M361]TRX59022.1 glucose-1-phosphate thymidylyltransferase [Fulvivirga sp. M361]
MHIHLFDEKTVRQKLLPLTYTRPVAEIRVGILTIAEKWQKWLKKPVFYQTEEYLANAFPSHKTTEKLFINGAVCPNNELITQIEHLQAGQALYYDNILIAGKNEGSTDLSRLKKIVFESHLNIIDERWKIFKLNAAEIKSDFGLITAGRTSAALTDPHTIVYGKENLFIEEGAVVKAAIINAEKGPVYLGKNTQVLEGAIIKGSFALCEGSTVNIGGKMRGDTTVGPYSKVGGEVSNSVIFGYSNKGHEGYLGNSVLGEWCNLGADTNTSNLRNDYGNVKVWSYLDNGFQDSGQEFCGLVMGDHSKCGINTMFNTGTVVGVSANIFGAGFPRNFVPSFSWGGSAGFLTYRLDKALDVAKKVQERRRKDLNNTDQSILKEVFRQSAQYRIWEKQEA